MPGAQGVFAGGNAVDRERSAADLTDSASDKDRALVIHCQVEDRGTLDRAALVDATPDPPLSTRQEPAAQVGAGRTCRGVLDR